MARYRYGKPLGALSAQRQRQETLKWTVPPRIDDLRGLLGGVVPSVTPQQTPGTLQLTPLGRFGKVHYPKGQAVMDYHTTLYSFIIPRFSGIGAGMIRMWNRYKADTEGYVVRSSFIHTILYNATSTAIIVVMRGGNAYYYGGKSPADFKRFVDSVSKGVHYNKSIKGTAQGPGGRAYKETHAGRW